VINRLVTRWARQHPGVRLTPHKRHAYGKHCVDRGVDIRIIAEALGHESLESTKIYTQVSFERPPHRRVTRAPGELKTPMRIRQRNQPPSRGRNFQK
jgi:integrase